MSDNHEKKYSVAQIALNLTAACFISGIIIAIVYFITAPVAAKNAVMIKEQSMKALVKEANEFTEVKGKKEWYEAKSGDKTLAYIIQTETKGYGGPIQMLVAVNSKGEVIDYNILLHNETPGLGDKATKSPFKDQFEGKIVDTLSVTKDPSDKKDVQAITGATISSRAITKGVKQAVEEVNEYLGGK